MEERRAGLVNGVRRLVFPGEPKKTGETKEGKPKELSIMFHLHLGRPDQLDPGLLSLRKTREVNDIFREVTGSSLADSSREYYHLDKADELVLWRVGRLAGNYIRLQPLLEAGCQLRAVGSGDSAICSALAAEAISLRTALTLEVKQSKLIAIAQGVHSGWLFRNRQFPFRTSKMEPYLDELKGAVAETDIQEPKVKIVGDKGQIITTAAGISQEIMRQPVEPSNEETVRRVLRRLAPPVQEIGLDEVDNTKKYLTIGTIVAGGIILTKIVHDKRQKPK
ncbi:hypothetical protein HYU45_01050 [Candidatus Daviesbacteria bacterium]|nr:hypothetical protein [Candidatus Daviesbacteria bacterium]